MSFVHYPLVCWFKRPTLSSGCKIVEYMTILLLTTPCCISCDFIWQHDLKTKQPHKSETFNGTTPSHTPKSRTGCTLDIPADFPIVHFTFPFHSKLIALGDYFSLSEETVKYNKAIAKDQWANGVIQWIVCFESDSNIDVVYEYFEQELKSSGFILKDKQYEIIETSNLNDTNLARVEYSFVSTGERILLYLKFANGDVSDVDDRVLCLILYDWSSVDNCV